MEYLLTIGVAILFPIVFLRLRALQATIEHMQNTMACFQHQQPAGAAPVTGMPVSPGPYAEPVAQAATQAIPPPPLRPQSPSAGPTGTIPVTPAAFTTAVPPAPASPVMPLPVVPREQPAGIAAVSETAQTRGAGSVFGQNRTQWEALIGGNLFNYIGALALFLGLAFLLKFAIDDNWVTPPLRVLLAYVAGIGLLLSGHRFHRKGLPIFAQGVIGAGVAVCYLCGFASYVPAIIGSPTAAPMVSYPVAFVLMTLAAALAFQQSLQYDSLPVALLGWIGGLLTPFILHNGDASLKRAVSLLTPLHRRHGGTCRTEGALGGIGTDDHVRRISGVPDLYLDGFRGTVLTLFRPLGISVFPADNRAAVPTRGGVAYRRSRGECIRSAVPGWFPHIYTLRRRGHSRSAPGLFLRQRWCCVRLPLSHAPCLALCMDDRCHAAARFHVPGHCLMVRIPPAR